MRWGYFLIRIGLVLKPADFFLEYGKGAVICYAAMLWEPPRSRTGVVAATDFQPVREMDRAPCALGSSLWPLVAAGQRRSTASICIDYDGTGSSPGLVEVSNGVGNAGLSNFIDILTGSPTGNVLVSTYINNGTSCAVIRFTSCVQPGANIVSPTAY